MPSYSALLIEFIDPLLTGTEDAEEFLSKAIIGQIAWNYCVSDENHLVLASEMETTVQELLASYPEMKQTLDMLMIRKATNFKAHQQFIFTVEKRHKADGSVTLYVESAPADKI